MRESCEFISENVENDKKKHLKGMTLLEVIIAMVVLVVLSTLIAEAGVGVVNNVRASKSVIEKVNYQSKYISGQSKTYKDVDGNDQNMNKTSISFQLQSTVGGNLGNPISADVYESPGMDVAFDYKDGTYKRADGSVYDRAGNLKYFE